jgi:hypothetical protein
MNTVIRPDIAPRTWIQHGKSPNVIRQNQGLVVLERILRTQIPLSVIVVSGFASAIGVNAGIPLAVGGLGPFLLVLSLSFL